jgi:hypothetical protein
MRTHNKSAWYREIIHVELINGYYYVFSYSGRYKVDLGRYNQNQINDVIMSYRDKGYQVKMEMDESIESIVEQTNSSPSVMVAKKSKNWYKRALAENYYANS